MLHASPGSGFAFSSKSDGSDLNVNRSISSIVLYERRFGEDEGHRDS